MIQRPHHEHSIELAVIVQAQVDGIHHIADYRIFNLPVLLLCLLNQFLRQVGQEHLISFRRQREGISAGPAAQVKD